MEKRFCGKCGKPMAECICGAPRNGAAIPPAGAHRPEAATAKRFDEIALVQDEVVVRQYHIGEFQRLLSSAGNGSASVIVTNKRIISKQDSSYLGSTTVAVEEILLENVAGVKNFYYHGITLWRLIIGALLALQGLVGFFTAVAQGSFMSIRLLSARCLRQAKCLPSRCGRFSRHRRRSLAALRA